jgi:hypothetical protein
VIRRVRLGVVVKGARRMLNDDLRARIEALDKQTLKGADRGAIRTKSLMADMIYEDSKYEPVYYMRKRKVMMSTFH